MKTNKDERAHMTALFPCTSSVQSTRVTVLGPTRSAI